MNFLEQAHIARLITFAQHGQPKEYGGSDMMRADLEELILSVADYEALEGRYFLRDGVWTKASPASIAGVTLYRRRNGAK